MDIVYFCATSIRIITSLNDALRCWLIAESGCVKWTRLRSCRRNMTNVVSSVISREWSDRAGVQHWLNLQRLRDKKKNPLEHADVPTGLSISSPRYKWWSCLSKVKRYWPDTAVKRMNKVIAPVNVINGYFVWFKRQDLTRNEILNPLNNYLFKVPFLNSSACVRHFNAELYYVWMFKFIIKYSYYFQTWPEIVWWVVWNTSSTFLWKPI